MLNDSQMILKPISDDVIWTNLLNDAQNFCARRICDVGTNTLSGLRSGAPVAFDGPRLNLKIKFQGFCEAKKKRHSDWSKYMLYPIEADNLMKQLTMLINSSRDIDKLIYLLAIFSL